jgi:hypothetical protein
VIVNRPVWIMAASGNYLLMLAGTVRRPSEELVGSVLRLE